MLALPYLHVKRTAKYFNRKYEKFNRKEDLNFPTKGFLEVSLKKKYYYRVNIRDKNMNRLLELSLWTILVVIHNWVNTKAAEKLGWNSIPIWVVNWKITVNNLLVSPKIYTILHILLLLLQISVGSHSFIVSICTYKLMHRNRNNMMLRVVMTIHSEFLIKILLYSVT